MRMTEHERERLLITLAADVADRRRGRGLKLNHPEAAILTSFVFEGARDGRTVTELMSAGCEVLRRDDVLPGVPEMIDSVGSRRRSWTAATRLRPGRITTAVPLRPPDPAPAPRARPATTSPRDPEGTSCRPPADRDPPDPNHTQEPR